MVHYKLGIHGVKACFVYEVNCISNSFVANPMHIHPWQRHEHTVKFPFGDTLFCISNDKSNPLSQQNQYLAYNAQ